MSLRTMLPYLPPIFIRTVNNVDFVPSTATHNKKSSVLCSTHFFTFTRKSFYRFSVVSWKLNRENWYQETALKNPETGSQTTKRKIILNLTSTSSHLHREHIFMWMVFYEYSSWHRGKRHLGNGLLKTGLQKCFWKVSSIIAVVGDTRCHVRICESFSDKNEPCDFSQCYITTVISYQQTSSHHSLRSPSFSPLKSYRATQHFWKREKW